MNEGISHKIEQAPLDDIAYRKLGEQIRDQIEYFQFPGLTEESYNKLKAESEEFPDLVTPIDTLVDMFRAQGAKIVVAHNGNCFVMPFNLLVTDGNLDNYTVRPKNLNEKHVMDLDLKRLILARR